MFQSKGLGVKKRGKGLSKFLSWTLVMIMVMIKGNTSMPFFKRSFYFLMFNLMKKDFIGKAC